MFVARRSPALFRFGFARCAVPFTSFTPRVCNYSDSGKHADKIRKAKANPIKKKPSAPKLRPKKKSNPLDLTFKPPAQRPGIHNDPDSDIDIGDPEIQARIAQLEQEHKQKQAENKPKQKVIVDYDVERIGEGEATEDEEEAELLEKIRTDEPAFSVSEYASQLSKASNMAEYMKINYAFTSEDYVEMLEGQYAENVNVIDVRSKSQLYSYMIIATMHSGRQRKAAANYIYLQGKKRYQLACEYGSPFVKQCLEKNQAEEVPSISKDAHEWVVIDCGNVSINLFDYETRKYYDLDNLWENEIKARDSVDALDWNIKMHAAYEKKGSKHMAELDYSSDEDGPILR